MKMNIMILYFLFFVFFVFLIVFQVVDYIAYFFLITFIIIRLLFLLSKKGKRIGSEFIFIFIFMLISVSILFLRYLSLKKFDEEMNNEYSKIQEECCSDRLCPLEPEGFSKKFKNDQSVEKDLHLSIFNGRLIYRVSQDRDQFMIKITKSFDEDKGINGGIINCKNNGPAQVVSPGHWTSQNEANSQPQTQDK